MLPSALSVAPLLLAAVLAVAGLAKLRSPRDGLSIFRSMGVPWPLATPAVAYAHPWLEIALALVLVLGKGPIGVLGAIASLCLMLAYLGLVLRVLSRGDDVDCDCFGALGKSTVTALTAFRNAWYVVLACLSIWAHGGNSSPQSTLMRFDSGEGLWLGAVAAGGLTVWLTVGGPRRTDATSVAAVSDEDREDYLRTRTPAVPVTLADGTVQSLRQLSGTRAQLLLFVSTSCGLCRTVIEQAPRWRKSLPMLDVRLVYTLPRPSQIVEPQDLTLYDPERWAYDTLGIQGTPSAVALGADGQLAGGPVAGPDDVADFVADLMSELRDLSRPPATRTT